MTGDEEEISKSRKPAVQLLFSTLDLWTERSVGTKLHSAVSIPTVIEKGVAS